MITFGANGVNVFQGLKFGITIQIRESWALFNLGMHCVSHHQPCNANLIYFSFGVSIELLKNMISLIINFNKKGPCLNNH
jgi:hypothetical protein